MDIGDTIIIKGTIVDFDSNPHGAAIKIKVLGYVDQDEKARLQNDEGKWKGSKREYHVSFWVHRLDQQEVLVR